MCIERDQRCSGHVEVWFIRLGRNKQIYASRWCGEDTVTEEMVVNEGRVRKIDLAVNRGVRFRIVLSRDLDLPGAVPLMSCSVRFVFPQILFVGSSIRYVENFEIKGGSASQSDLKSKTHIRPAKHVLWEVECISESICHNLQGSTTVQVYFSKESIPLHTRR